MKHKLNKMLASGAVVAGSLLLATMLSAQAPAGGAAPAGTPAGGAPAMGGFGGGMGGFGGGPQGGGNATVSTVSQIQEKFPDEYKAAQELRQKDPAAYRAKMRDLQQKLTASN